MPILLLLLIIIIITITIIIIIINDIFVAVAPAAFRAGDEIKMPAVRNLPT